MSESPGGEVVTAARALAAAGLVDAFGHVSARVGDVALITPGLPMAAIESVDQLVEMELGEIDDLPAGAPKEAWMHWAIYRARPELGSICRGQPSSPLAVAVIADELPALAGQAAIAGAPVPVFRDSRLVRDRGRAVELAEALGDAPSVIMRGNGALATGSTAGRAMARLYLLERAADIYLRAAAAGDPRPLDAVEAEAWQSAGEELLERLWQYLRPA